MILLAAALSYSAARPPEQPFAVAVARHAALNPPQQDSAYTSRRSIEDLDLDAIPRWESRAQVQRGFEQIREVRFNFSDAQPHFARRSTWLFPDDGCFARAALAADNLARWSFPETAKVFSFGNLVVATTNHPSGSVSWWYHVAPIVRVGDEALVLDPALSPLAPMPLTAWLAAQSPDPDRLEAALCNADAYEAMGPCESATASVSRAAMTDQRGFLNLEWRRQEELGRDPTKVLGESPIWSDQ